MKAKTCSMYAARDDTKPRICQNCYHADRKKGVCKRAKELAELVELRKMRG